MVSLWHRIYKQEQLLCFGNHLWHKELLQWDSMNLQGKIYIKIYRCWWLVKKIKGIQILGSDFCNWHSDEVEICTCIFHEILSLVIWHITIISVQRRGSQLVEVKWFFLSGFFILFKIFHLYSDGYGDRWGTFQYQRVSVVYVWRHINQKLVWID